MSQPTWVEPTTCREHEERVDRRPPVLGGTGPEAVDERQMHGLTGGAAASANSGNLAAPPRTSPVAQSVSSGSSQAAGVPRSSGSTAIHRASRAGQR
ncbi:hypothetical protein [Streptomyces wuyuanensis]|uniref:hypothetical protein n=1 Tax=Streptomyces wuyuanensis TaxID=1196353 RepID=UPI0036B0A177